jgi:hypothetical protein
VSGGEREARDRALIIADRCAALWLALDRGDRDGALGAVRTIEQETHLLGLALPTGPSLCPKVTGAGGGPVLEYLNLPGALAASERVEDLEAGAEAGWRRFIDARDEAAALRDEVASLGRELREARSRIADLEADAEFLRGQAARDRFRDGIWWPR